MSEKYHQHAYCLVLYNRVMLIFKPAQFAKAIFVSFVAVFGLTVTHSAMLTSSSSMEGMGGHSSSPIQCLGVCSTGLPSEKQDGILRSERDDEKDGIAPHFEVEVVLALIVLAFVVKRLFSLSSWRPPDLVKLQGSYLFYA